MTLKMTLKFEPDRVVYDESERLIRMFALNGLPRLYHPSMNYRNAHRASDDRFLLVIEADDPKFTPVTASEDLRSAGARDVEVVEG